MQDPLLTSAQGVTTYSLLCDDDCQVFFSSYLTSMPDHGLLI